jgi:hypothetical protein
MSSSLHGVSRDPGQLTGGPDISPVAANEMCPPEAMGNRQMLHVLSGFAVVIVIVIVMVMASSMRSAMATGSS